MAASANIEPERREPSALFLVTKSSERSVKTHHRQDYSRPARQPAGPFPLLAAPCWRRPSVAVGWPLVRGTSVFGIRPEDNGAQLTGINDAGLLLCFALLWIWIGSGGVRNNLQEHEHVEGP